MEPYQIAQQAIANLKTAVFLTLKSGPEEGMKNSEIGRSLGIYTGHDVGDKSKHQGHISRSILALMEADEVVVQEKDKKNLRWRLK